MRLGSTSVIAVAPPFPPPPPPPPHALLAARSLGKLPCSPVSYCFSRCFVEEKLGKKRRREACVRVCAFLCVCGIGISLSRVHAPAVGRSFLLARARSLSLPLHRPLSLSRSLALSVFSRESCSRNLLSNLSARNGGLQTHADAHAHSNRHTSTHMLASLRDERKAFSEFCRSPGFGPLKKEGLCVSLFCVIDTGSMGPATGDLKENFFLLFSN